MSEFQRPLKVFLSYAVQDRPLVRELSRQLVGEGWIDTWVDEKSLLPGQDWRVKIEEAVEEADVVIICLSNHSVSKEGYVQKELRYAREIALEKPEETIFLIPLRLDECEVPRGLRFYQWVDYFGEGKDNGYDNLVKSLKLRYEQKLKLEELERIREENARLEAEELARQKAEKEKVDREAAEKATREKEGKEAAEKARLEAEERTRQKAAKEKAERDAFDKAARDNAEKESVEKTQLEAEEQAMQKAAKEQVEREATEKADHEKTGRESEDETGVDGQVATGSFDEVKRNSVVSNHKSLVILLWAVFLAMNSLVGLVQVVYPTYPLTVISGIIGILNICISSFLIFRKEIWKNYSYLALVAFLIAHTVLNGIALFSINASIFMPIVYINNFIALLSAIFLGTQRDNWKRWGMVMTIASLFVYFLENTFFLSETGGTIINILALVSAILLLLDK